MDSYAKTDARTWTWVKADAIKDGLRESAVSASCLEIAAVVTKRKIESKFMKKKNSRTQKLTDKTREANSLLPSGVTCKKNNVMVKGEKAGVTHRLSPWQHKLTQFIFSRKQLVIASKVYSG
ncbi:hypothetical protein J6590_068545 [Homalodisca vitripennis]|nr:hypothetical protein J6590_068545 [Homalodisca vitripennis]